VNCLHCGRPLRRFAISVPTRGGALGWGPKCARSLGIVTGARAARAKRPKPAHPRPDPRQQDLFGQAAA
jgi:hypothetical protein